MRVDNARRVTGPSVLAVAGPCAAIEWLDDEADRAHPNRAALRDARLDELRGLLAALGPELGVGPLTFSVREHGDGAGRTLALAGVAFHGALRLEGPIDRLYPLVDWLEWASLELAAERFFLASTDPSARLAEARAKWAELLVVHGPGNPALLELEAAAREHGVPFLWDDEHVSLGWGPTCRSWPATELPSLRPEDAKFELLDFRTFRRIPVALVTGTNGKTTTTRMLARILRLAGYHVGASSTDGITVDEQLVEAGDWSGPGAARKVLRRTDVDAAVLETARGGILRRGLGVPAPEDGAHAAGGADAAIVTNIGADHFGEYGVTTLAEMAEVKGVVWRVVRPSGACVVNVDDPTLAELVRRDVHGPATSRAPWVAFGLDPQDPLLAVQRGAGQRIWFMREGQLTTAQGVDEVALIAASAIPATFGGTALHNIYNALGAAALAFALGVSPAIIRDALESFGKTPADNPGRLEHHQVDGVSLVLDFGHNAHGVHAIRGAIQALVAKTPGARLFVSLGQAGDRSDTDIMGLAREVHALSPQVLFSRPVHGYERGREPFDVPRILVRTFAELGYDPDHNRLAEGEVAVIEAALAEARPGDVILVLVHIEREAVRLWLEAKNSCK